MARAPAPFGPCHQELLRQVSFREKFAPLLIPAYGESVEDRAVVVGAGQLSLGRTVGVGADQRLGPVGGVGPGHRFCCIAVILLCV